MTSAHRRDRAGLLRGLQPDRPGRRGHASYNVTPDAGGRLFHQDRLFLLSRAGAATRRTRADAGDLLRRSRDRRRPRRRSLCKKSRCPILSTKPRCRKSRRRLPTRRSRRSCRELTRKTREPEPWPTPRTTTTTSCRRRSGRSWARFRRFIMLFGAVLWMHGSGPWMGLIGFAGVLYVMFAWWSEVVHESQTGDHTPVVRHRPALWLHPVHHVRSDVLLGLVLDLLQARACIRWGRDSPAVDGVWPPAGIETFDPWHLPLINTLILLCSGCAATWAHHALVHENNRKDLINGPDPGDRAGRAVHRLSGL